MSKTTIVREKIWAQMKAVAMPDSRFHLNFAEVIPDFTGSDCHRSARRVPFYRGQPLRFHHPGQQPRRAAPADDRGRHLRDVDLQHPPRLPCSSPRIVPRATSSTPPGSTASSTSASRSRSKRSPTRALRLHGHRRLGGVGRRHPLRQGHGTSTSNGACSPISASSTRDTRSRPSSTTCRWSRTSSIPSETDILGRPHRDADAPDRVERRAPAARHQVGPAHPSRSPRRRRSRSCADARGRMRVETSHQGGEQHEDRIGPPQIPDAHERGRAAVGASPAWCAARRGDAVHLPGVAGSTMPSSPATSSPSTTATTPTKASISTYLSGGPDVIPESSLIAGKADLTLTTPDTTVKAIVDQGATFKIIGAQYQKNPIGIVSLAKTRSTRRRTSSARRSPCRRSTSFRSKRC